MRDTTTKATQRTRSRLALTIARLWLIGLGAFILLWTGREDNEIATVAALGVLLGASIVAYGMLRRGMERVSATSQLTWLAAGAAGGCLANLMSCGLMLFKNARHAHAFPDYPLPLVLDALQRLPAWALAGALVGLGASLAWRAIKGE